LSNRKKWLLNVWRAVRQHKCKPEKSGSSLICIFIPMLITAYIAYIYMQTHLHKSAQNMFQLTTVGSFAFCVQLQCP